MRSLHCLTLKHDFEISSGHIPVLERNFVVVFAIEKGCANGQKPFDRLAEYEKYIYINNMLLGCCLVFVRECFIWQKYFRTA